MPIKDNKSNTDIVIMANHITSSDGTFLTTAIDTADYDNGFTIVPFLNEYSGAGNVILVRIEESDTFAGVYTKVDDNMINGTITNDGLPVVSGGEVVAKTYGIFGTLRFIRANFLFSQTTSATLTCIANANHEVRPD